MKYIAAVWIVVLAVVMAGCAGMPGSDVAESAAARPLPYRQFVVGAERPGPFALVLFLHGAGERGDDNAAQLKHGSAELIGYCRKNGIKAVLLFPQCPRDRWWAGKEPPEGGSMLTALEALLDAKTEEFKPDRVYAVGLSMGGFAVWELALRNPERFAAVMPVCGGGDPARAAKLTGLPVLAVHGSADTVVPVRLSREMVRAIWNAGGEGQLHIGAAAATYVVLHLNGCSRFVTVLLAFLAAFICAGIYGLIPAILKVKWKVNELITCLMLNYVATFFVSWLIQGPWKDPTGFAFPRTRKIPSAGELTTFFGTRIHTGLIIGLVIALALWFVIYKTRWGFEIKLIGAKEKVARYAGMSVNRNILLVMFLSAGIAGVAGMVEICGITHRLQANFASQLGSSGMTIAYLAQCHPLAAVVVSFLFGGLLVGGNTIQKLGLPVSTVQMIQGSILIFVAAGGMFTKYRIVRKERRLGND